MEKDKTINKGRAPKCPKCNFELKTSDQIWSEAIHEPKEKLKEEFLREYGNWMIAADEYDPDPEDPESNINPRLSEIVFTPIKNSHLKEWIFNLIDKYE